MLSIADIQNTTTTALITYLEKATTATAQGTVVAAQQGIRTASTAKAIDFTLTALMITAPAVELALTANSLILSVSHISSVTECHIVLHAASMLPPDQL